MRAASLLFVVLLVGCGGGDDPEAPDTPIDSHDADILDASTEIGADVVAGEPVSLVTGGVSDHVIVLPEAPSASQLYAAEELIYHIEACTGITLEVVPNPPGDDTPVIVLGVGPAAEALGVAPTGDDLGEQGFAIRTVPPHIVIAGTAEAGTLFGVHRFLEDALGVRWYAP